MKKVTGGIDKSQDSNLKFGKETRKTSGNRGKQNADLKIFP